MLNRRGSMNLAVLVRLSIALIVVTVAVQACGGSSPTAPNTPPDGGFSGEASTDVVAVAGSLIDIEVATNGEDADKVLGPQIPVGDPITWTYVVANSGSLPLIGIVVTDDQLGVIDCPSTNLSSGRTMTCEAFGVAAEGQHRNIAVATAANSQGQEATDADPTHYFGITPGVPAVDLEKATNDMDADLETGPEIVVGDLVTWTYQVTNTGDVPLIDIEVTDDQLGVIACPLAALAPGEYMRCESTGYAEEGQYRNLGTVVGRSDIGEEARDEDPSHYFGLAVVDTPEIDIEKATNGRDADRATGPIIPVGDQVVWTYVVTNTGNVDLGGISVMDDQIGSIVCPKHALSPDEEMTCVATGIAVEGQYGNIGKVTATDAIGTEVSDKDHSHYFGLVEVPGYAGCSHGYWKNHLDSWGPTPFSPSDPVKSLFSSSMAYAYIADSTLLEALQFNGGPGVDGAIRIMLRDAVAAALNAAHPDVNYPDSLHDIVDAVNAAIDTDDRQAILSFHGGLGDSNNLGCSLN